jgi:hypothetical protein
MSRAMATSAPMEWYSKALSLAQTSVAVCQPLCFYSPITAAAFSRNSEASRIYSAIRPPGTVRYSRTGVRADTGQ